MKKGLFITFEGSDGSGKTTQIKLLKSFLEENGYSPVVTREPGGTKIGELVRDIILDKDNSEMSNMTEMLLYAASRAQHVDEFIRPNLLAGKIVISDRFIDSSIVYQGYGRKLGDNVSLVNNIAIGDCAPDATFLLLVDPHVGFTRVNRGPLDRIEAEGQEYQKQVTNAYIEHAKAFPDRIVTVDADNTVEAIQEIISKRVLELLEQYKSDIE